MKRLQKKLRNWSCERNSDVITFSTQGRNICVPQNFIYSILVVLSLRFNNELALNWLNDFNTDFISEVKVELPKWLIEFASGSHCPEIVELAVRKMSKADVVMSARWHDFGGDHKATFLKIVDKKFKEDTAKPISKNFPTLNYSISLLKRHVASSADKEGNELLKALQAIKISENDGVSEFPQFKEAKPKEEKMDFEISLTNELKNYFEAENVTSARLHSILKKISAVEDLSPVIASLMPLIGKNNSAVYTTHITGFGNIVRRIGMTLQKKNKLIDLEDFIPIMTRHLSEDRVESNQKLNTLRLIAMDFHRKIFTKAKSASKPKQIPATVEVKSLVTLINKEREKKSRVALQTLDTSPNEDQLLGHLSDILVDDYHRVFTSTNEADLKLFFNASSQQLQSIFLSTADWDVIHNAITFLLSERSSDVNHNSILDFLWASERLRRLWKGREQSAERAKEHIIIMTVSQVEMYLHHFLAGCEDESEMETRLPQLFHFLRGAKMKDRQFVDLRKHVESLKVGSEHLRSKLANLLYLFRPAGQEGTKIVGAESSACSVDKIVYRVILDLAAIGDSPGIGDKMSDAFLFSLSLTSTHPHLLLRHLNLMARLLKGRCHNELKEFRTQRHMDYFSNLATVMCHLAPHMMEDRYLPTFKDIISECLEFLRVYPKIARRQSRPTSNHIFALLKRFLELDIVNGLKFLEEYTTLWHDLMAVYGTDTRDVQLYHAIFVVKVPQYQVPEHVLLAIQNDNFRGLDPADRIHIEHNLTGFPNMVIESIRSIHAALEDKGPKAVMPFEYGILDALTCILPDARAMAFDILLELIQHEPSKIKIYYQRMLNAMDQGPEILATERVMKFTVLAMTKSDEILKTVFRRGQKHDINVAKTIGRTISLLALLPAY